MEMPFTGDDDDTEDGISLDNLEVSDRFVDILMYHVVGGASVAAADIAPFPGSFLPTALDSYVVNPYQTDDGGVVVYSREKRMSHVVSPNIEYDNGIIHTIDAVLLPPVGPADTALDLGLTYFYGALEATDLTADVATANGITVFVPTNQAFIDVGGQLQDLLSTSESDVSTLLQYHVVPNMPYYTTNLTDGDTLETLAQTPFQNGLDVHIDEEDGALYVNNARVITANILLSNGVAHLIDEVLNPANDDDGGYVYTLGDDGLGVPAFEDAASATLPALTSGIPATAVGTYAPSSTFTAASGAEAARGNYRAEMLGGVLAAGALGLVMA